MPVDEFGDLLAIPIPDSRSYHTLAGFTLQHFGAIPVVGDSFDYNGWRIEVVDLDGRRIDKLLASRLKSPRRAA